MNGYRPIVELMNTNFGIYGMAELSSAGNTYATTGGQFDMPLTIIGAGGTAPNQALGAEHSQVWVSRRDAWLAGGGGGGGVETVLGYHHGVVGWLEKSMAGKKFVVCKKYWCFTLSASGSQRGGNRRRGCSFNTVFCDTAGYFTRRTSSTSEEEGALLTPFFVILPGISPVELRVRASSNHSRSWSRKRMYEDQQRVTSSVGLPATPNASLGIRISTQPSSGPATRGRLKTIPSPRALDHIRCGRAPASAV